MKNEGAESTEKSQAGKAVLRECFRKSEKLFFPKRGWDSHKIRRERMRLLMCCWGQGSGDWGAGGDWMVAGGPLTPNPSPTRGEGLFS